MNLIRPYNTYIQKIEMSFFFLNPRHFDENELFAKNCHRKLEHTCKRHIFQIFFKTFYEWLPERPVMTA